MYFSWHGVFHPHRRRIPAVNRILVTFFIVTMTNSVSAAKTVILPAIIPEPRNMSAVFESYDGGADRLDEILTGVPFLETRGLTVHHAFTMKPVWFRFTYRFASETGEAAVLALGNYTFTNVDFFARQDGRTISEYHTGSARPFATRPLELRDFTFPLPRSTDSVEVYVRIQSSTPLNFTPRIRSMSDTLKKENTDQIVAGLLFGAQAILILYNFFLFLTLRDRSYLFYSLYVMGWLLFETKTTGFLARYIFFSAPRADVLLLPGIVYFTLSAFVLFTENFLYPRARSAASKRVRYTAAACGFLPVPIMFLPQHITIPAAIPLNLICTGYVTYRTFSAWRNGIPSAGYFLVAVLCSIALLPFFALTRVIPVTAGFSIVHFIFHYGVPLILLAEALLLSFALADRYRHLREEKERQEAEFAGILQAEKARINAELHDVIGSDLSLLRFSLAAKKRKPKPAELQAKLDLTLRKLREMVALNNIDPNLAQNLSEDFRNRARETGDVTGLKVSAKIEDIVLTLPQAFHLQRIYGESLTNAVRHARATKIGVCLKRRHNRVFLAVADNGRGILPHTTTLSGSGLRNLADRARRIGARLRIFSDGTGTTVALWLPYGN